MILIAAAIAFAGAAHSAARGQTSEGLRVESPPSVLADPTVRRCRLMAVRGVDPAANAGSSPVETAASYFRVEPVFDAVATCRAALAAYPSEPAVIIAQYNASEALKMLALGLKLPDREDEVFGLALSAADGSGIASGLVAQLVAFLIASDYEWGVGTKPDRQAAMKWYARAAQAGSRIAEREFKRLQVANP